MALSDYLTNEEWDACFYASFGKARADNFGESMRITIDTLLAKGYKFAGLDEDGRKLQQIKSDNPKKLVHFFFGEKNDIKLTDVLKSGRGFLKTNCPSLINESDSDFDEAIEGIREVEK